jgi:hypothetical protein
MGDLIEAEYRGIKYTISQEAIDDMLKLHGINAIQQIEQGIDFELDRLSVTTEVDLKEQTAKLKVTRNQ